MRIAKASDDDITALRDFLLELEEADDEDLEAIAAIVRRFPIGWRRVVEGYQALVDNACDPALSHLEFKPEIRALMKASAWAEEELIG